MDVQQGSEAATAIAPRWKSARYSREDLRMVEQAAFVFHT